MVDKIKQSAVADRRCYIVEVMGRRCGYLALMSGLATGAERVYLHEEGITLKSMKEDLDLLVEGFKGGKRVGLVIRNEEANPTYDTYFMSQLFEEESGGVFAVRESILGHLQQGGDPSPFDRIQATKLARRCVGYLIEQASEQQPAAAFIGMVAGKVQFHALEDLPRMMDEPNRRPKTQWWLGLRAIADALARSGPAVRRRHAGREVDGGTSRAASAEPHDRGLTLLLPRPVRPLRVLLDVRAVEVDLAQVAGGVALGLVVEVRRRRIAALAAGAHRPRPHAVAELHHRHEAVAARAVHLLRARVGARAERRQRSPARRREADRDARPGVVERLDDVAGETLVAVDLAPRRLPRAEVGGQPVDRGRERLDERFRRRPWRRGRAGSAPASRPPTRRAGPPPRPSTPPASSAPSRTAHR